jgi:hypothetical protein
MWPWQIKLRDWAMDSLNRDNVVFFGHDQMQVVRGRDMC